MNRQLATLLGVLTLVVLSTIFLVKNYNPETKAAEEEMHMLRRAEEIQRLIGQAYGNMIRGDYSTSERILNQLLEIAPENQLAYQMLGQIYLNQGRYALSEKTYRQLLESMPENAINYNNLAQAIIRQKRYAEAIPMLEKSIELNPKVAIPRINLAELYVILGEKQKAIEQLRMADNLFGVNLAVIATAPAFEELRNEPGFQEIFVRPESETQPDGASPNE